MSLSYSEVIGVETSWNSWKKEYGADADSALEFAEIRASNMELEGEEKQEYVEDVFGLISIIQEPSDVVESRDINDFERIIEKLEYEIQDAKDNLGGMFDNFSKERLNGYIYGLEMAIGIVKDCEQEVS